MRTKAELAKRGELFLLAGYMLGLSLRLERFKFDEDDRMIFRRCSKIFIELGNELCDEHEKVTMNIPDAAPHESPEATIKTQCEA